jgi:pimeloyl-ACP methyl ester carboxylesterase
MLATVNGVEFAYTDEGKGFPLVFLHGFPLNRRAWSTQIQAFQARHRVIAPDLRGFGESASTRGAIPMARYAADVLGLLEQLEVDRFILVGHSMGGYIAQSIAETAPEKLRGLVLVATRAGADTEAVAQSRRTLAEEVLTWGTASVLADQASKLLATSNLDPAMAGRVRACMAPASSDGIHGALLGMAERSDLRGNLARIRVPTLIVAGAEDGVIPIQESEAMFQAIPEAQLSLIPKAGHLVALEQGAAFNEVLREWLAWGCQGHWVESETATAQLPEGAEARQAGPKQGGDHSWKSTTRNHVYHPFQAVLNTAGQQGGAA